MSLPPGWYPDPADRSTQRYWDGEGWLGAPLPVAATPPPGPPPADPPATPDGPAAGGGWLTGPPPAPATQPSPGPPPGSGAPPAAGPGAPTGAVGGPGGAHQNPSAAWPDHQGAPRPGPANPGHPAPADPGHPASGGPDHPVPGGVPTGLPGPGQPGHGQPGPYPGVPAYRGPLPPAIVHGLPVAPLGARFVARVIDVGAVGMLALVVNSWFLYRAGELLIPIWREVIAASQRGDVYRAPPPPELDTYLMLILGITTALWAAYEIPALAFGNRTLGKRLAGIQVVRLDRAGPIGVGRALLRWNPLGLATLLWCCGCLGPVLQFIDCVAVLYNRPLRQALHDRAAMTVVVATPRTPAAGDPAGARPTGDTP
ncbi:hypothetical protein GCM10010123_29930 [Pilimelia anulata]|uniref:RDD family protein n=1 Tax=Pilimelia anulata TaxID=53371 RepID=A0A8J3BCI8_9ACTN|nr:RDD family protein [Pilimelia anulata]GGJ97862.1 hypothetical protein GCM10010123_29930 [Pilimelia anulata]